jgi:hypothetical protein
VILFQDEFYILHPTVFDIKNVYAHQNDPLRHNTLTTFLDTLAKVILLPDHMQAGYDIAVVATLEPKFDDREALRLFIKQLSTHTLANRCGVITRYLSAIRLLEEHGPMITAAIPMRTKEVPKLRPKPGTIFITQTWCIFTSRYWSTSCGTTTTAEFRHLLPR